MIDALSIFTTTTLIAVIANSLNGYGFHWDYSISRYVGLEAWSSIMFGAGNFVVAYLMLKALWGAGRRWQMKWFYFVIVVVMLLAILGLSVCPIGRFDRIYEGEPGPVSLIHEFCSRTMFALMLLTSSIVMFCGKVGKPMRIAAAGFSLMGIVYGAGYLTGNELILRGMLFFESMYLVSFMILGLLGQSSKALSRNMNDNKDEAAENLRQEAV